jgi:hypothetical protein
MVMQSPPTSDIAVESFDSSRPFNGLVLCCTSIEADQRVYLPPLYHTASVLMLMLLAPDLMTDVLSLHI